jgi:hypothetical protein
VLGQGGQSNSCLGNQGSGVKRVPFAVSHEEEEFSRFTKREEDSRNGIRMIKSTASALEHLYANLSKLDVLQQNCAHVFKYLQKRSIIFNQSSMIF